MRDTASHADGFAFGAGVVAGRVHELCGPARRTAAAMLAGQAGGDFFWIAPPQRARETPDPRGLCTFVQPERMMRILCPSVTDALWAAEEVLRAGVGGLVAVNLDTPPLLTPVRRLQLAAEAGGRRATAVLLCPGEGGAAGVESRWHVAPDPGGGWNLRRLRARMAPPAEMHLPGWPASPCAAPPAGASLSGNTADGRCANQPG